MKIKINADIKEYYTLWREGKTVKMIDQRKLPHRFEIISLKDHKQTAKAIKNMVCRGAGAIGVAAAYAMAQAALEAKDLDKNEFLNYLHNATKTIKGTRPTAVNLFNAVKRCLRVIKEDYPEENVKRILEEADKIAQEDLESSKKIGEFGAKFIPEDGDILTHCNAGALAFIDLGTALSPIRFAHNEGKKIHVFVDETRPRCQGACLTAWELQQEGIPYHIIVDNAAGFYMQRKEIDLVIVGADRITRKGDVINKIGTYEKAVLAKENVIPFYVAAPKMTFDLNTFSGYDVEIEERDIEEITHIWGTDEKGNIKRVRITGSEVKALNPAFDITPARYISGFITEKGIINPPFYDNIKRTLM
jgi:S-methyl-5-thioribose-1-phosphate isomerase